MFRILHGGYLLKQKEVVVQTPEWTFKVNIVEMPHLKGIRPNFGPIWVNNGKKLIIFKNFTLDGQY